MKKEFLIACFAIFAFMSQEAIAQVSINNIMGNKIRNTEGYDGIEGNPYFIKDWVSGQVIFASGKEAKVDFLKYDLILDQPFFSDEGKDAIFAFTEPVRAFVLRGAVFQNNFPAVGNFNTSSYYQVIAKGKYSLLKKEENTVGERTAVGVPSIRYIKKNLRYYVFTGTDMKVIKADAKTLAEALNVSKDDLEGYAKDNKLSFKNDSDLKLIFENFSK